MTRHLVVRLVCIIYILNSIVGIYYINYPITFSRYTAMPVSEPDNFRQAMIYTFAIITYYFWSTLFTEKRVEKSIKNQSVIGKQRIGILYVALSVIHLIFSDKDILFGSTEYLAISNPSTILPLFPLFVSSSILVLTKYLTVFLPFFWIMYSDVRLNILHRMSCLYGILLLNAQNSRWLVVMIFLYALTVRVRWKSVLAGAIGILTFIKVLTFRSTTMHSITSSLFGWFSVNSWFSNEYFMALLINVNQGMTNLALGLGQSPDFRLRHFLYNYSIIPGWPNIPLKYPRINEFVPYNAWNEVYYSGIVGIIIYLGITGGIVGRIAKYSENIEGRIHSLLFVLILLLQSQYSLRFSFKILCLQLLILEMRRRKLRSTV